MDIEDILSVLIITLAGFVVGGLLSHAETKGKIFNSIAKEEIIVIGGEYGPPNEYKCELLPRK